MRVVLSAAISVALAGCVPPGARQVEQSAEKERKRILLWGLEHMVSADCNWEDEEDTDHPPGKHKIEQSGVEAKQPCGLVAVQVLDNSEKFVDDVCFGQNDAECDKRQADMFLARLEERYPLTDWTVVNRKCRAYPADCRYFIDVEKWSIASHNRAVRAFTEKALQESRSRERQVLDQLYHRQRQALADAFMAFSQSFDKNRCRTHTNAAGVTTTSCK